MKKISKSTSNRPIQRAGKLLLIILVFPFALTGVLIWAAVLLGRAAANNIQLAVNSKQ